MDRDAFESNKKRILPRRAFTDPQSYPENQHLGRSVASTASHHQQQSDYDGGRRKSKSIKPNVNIKPLLRMMSRNDQPSISVDLSRSSLEYEGLGIYPPALGRDRLYGEDAPFSGHSMGNSRGPPPIGGSIHYRSTSGPSYFSPMISSSRATYRPRVDFGDRISFGANSEDRSNDSVLGRIRGPQLSLQTTGTTTSTTPTEPSPGSYSPASGAARHSLTFSSRDPNTASLDSPSPTSRSSLDFVFRPKRTSGAADPVSRAAAVQAARNAFEEKEAEKTRKFEMQQVKAEERQMRRREKPHWHHRASIGQRSSVDGRTSVDYERVVVEQAATTNSPAPTGPEAAVGMENEVLEKSANAEDPGPGPNVARHVPPDDSSLPRQKSEWWKAQSKNTWVLFLTWLRTRLFKLNRRLRRAVFT